MGIASEYYMPTPTSVTSVRAPFGYIFGTVEMSRSGSALAGTAQHFYIIYEVGISHM